MSEPIGQCFSWAAKFAVGHSGAVVCHGSIRHPEEPRMIAHAWAEWRGKAYDYQTEVMGRKPMTIAAWYKKNEPQIDATYKEDEALVLALKHGNWGPFNGVKRLPGGGTGRRFT